MGGKLPPYAVAESDGLPVVYQPWKIIFPNGTITDVGDGTVYVGIGTSISTTTSITVSSYDVRSPVLVNGTVLYFLTDGSIGNFLNGAGTYTSVYDARSPLLSAGTVLSILTDGSTTSFLRGDGTYSTLSSPIAYAPSNAYYIVQTNDGVLSNEQVLAALSTGVVKNTAVTGVLSIASGGVDFENILTAGSPMLRIGNVFHIDTASATKNGYLQLSDFNNFSAKADTSTTVSTVAPLAGGGDLSANRVISITTDGTTTNYLRGDGSYRSVYEARTPLLSAGTVLSISTDGTTTNYFRGDGTYAIPSSNGGIKLAVFTIYSSASWTAENIPVFQAPYETPITIKQVNVTTSGSSPLLGFNLQMRPWGTLANTGSDVFISLQSAPTTGIEIVSAISSPIALAKSHIIFSSSAIILGLADYVTGAIYYSRNSI
jgi:hypothetical protein